MTREDDLGRLIDHVHLVVEDVGASVEAVNPGLGKRSAPSVVVAIEVE
jgi:hypothetical protein